MTSPRHNRIAKALSVIAGVVAFAAANVAYSYQIENLPNVGVTKDFVVGPGKTEAVMKPGQSRTVNLTVTNRMGTDKTFEIGVEDFTGSRSADATVVLLGDEKGPYSLKDYVSVPEKSFVLKHGQRATVPVTISVPLDAEPGGRYGSVVVSTVSNAVGQDAETGATGGAAIVSRIGTLFFVTVPGDVLAEGRLEGFSTVGNRQWFSSGPVRFQLVFENTGRIHLNPYGEIRITNMLGEEVGQLTVEPWFAMPDSIRLREKTWDRTTMFGVYTAKAKIYRGYGDEFDEKSFTFYVFPWKIVAGIFGGLIMIFFLLKFVASKFEIRRK